MHRIVLGAFLATVLITLPGPLHAQELDADGKKLESLFTKMIAGQKKTFDMQGASYEYKGDLNIEKADGYYAVTLPHFSLTYPSGYKFEVGMVAVNAAPHDKDGSWKMSVALPTPMTFYNPQGEPTTLLNIGSQRSAGVWDENLGYFSKLDSKFENVNLVGKEDNFNLSLPSVNVIYDLDQNENKLWSGPVSFAMKDLNVNADGIENAVAIGQVKLAMEMFDYNPQGMIEYRDAMANTLKGVENGEEKELTPAEFNTLAQAFITALGDGFVSNYEIKDFALKGSKEASFNSVKIDHMQFGFDLRGLLEKKLDMNLRLGYEGLDLKPVPANMPKLAPTNVKLDIAVDDVPIDELQKLGAQTADTATQNPGAAQMQAMGAAMQLPAILAKAKSRIEFTRNYIGNDIYNVTLDGSAKPNPASPLMTEASFTAAILGFDEIVKSITEQIQKGGAEAQQLQGIMAGLMMVKGFAEAVPNDEGKVEHILKFDMTPEGKVTLNGQDISALLGMAGGNAAPQTAPQEQTAPAVKEESAPVEPAEQPAEPEAAPEDNTPKQEDAAPAALEDPEASEEPKAAPAE